MTNDELDELEQQAELKASTSVSGEKLRELIELARLATGRENYGKCAYCLRPAVRLCDWLWCGVDGKLSVEKSKTCDKPLCLEHAHEQGGQIFLCGPKGLRTDTVDYCPSHNTEHRITGHVYSKRPQSAIEPDVREGR